MSTVEVEEVARAEAPLPSSSGLLRSLRDVSLTIDMLWRSALDDGSLDMALPLGEASHAVHRALIALGPQ